MKSGTPPPRVLSTNQPQANRRQVLHLLAGAALVPFLPVVPILGCGGAGTSSGTDSGSGSGADGSTGGSSASDGGISPTGWASGGTAAMTAKASYPDPFTSALATCSLVATTTEGPCTTTTDLSRADVSDGWKGLPVRFALKVVDASCNPLAGATVKIWHTNYEGSYSGQTPNTNMCLKQQAYSANNFFRGVQTTDAKGVVAFDTCFPGWYRGRTIHIHYAVGHDGKTFTSQLVFDQALVASIFASHPDYASFGAPDTTNASDNVVGGKDLSTFVLDTQKMSDGAMLASKTLVVGV